MDTIAHLLIATHTTAPDVICARAGGCDTDPLTVVLTLGLGGLLIWRWLQGRIGGTEQ